MRLICTKCRALGHSFFAVNGSGDGGVGGVQRRYDHSVVVEEVVRSRGRVACVKYASVLPGCRGV